jgi:ABC-type multidrug transport system ATPase subunit
VLNGEIFGFLGPNGAGKSTTMRILLGLVRPTSGTAAMLGKNIASHLPSILTRVGSLIESPTFYPYLSGRDNLNVMATITGASRAEVPNLLELVGLTSAARRKFKTYSLGMKQRLAVASTLINRPELLILDEPANGLDPAGIVEMRELLRRLKGEGHTIFISSHVLHEIENVCDRIAILDQGRLVVQGRVRDLLASQGRIEIAVEGLERARQVLEGLTWVEEVSESNGRLLVKAPLARAAELNEALARQEIFASAIQTQEESLERYFLGVTQARS